MKSLIALAFLFCPVLAHGQDLIVTITADSLKCKIVEVGTDEIQFRFGTNGNTISINRTEVASYRYNYGTVPTTEKKITAEKSDTKQSIYSGTSRMTRKGGKVYIGTQKIDNEMLRKAFENNPDLYFDFIKGRRQYRWGNGVTITGAASTIFFGCCVAFTGAGVMDGLGNPIWSVPFFGSLLATGGGIAMIYMGKNKMSGVVKEYNLSIGNTSSLHYDGMNTHGSVVNLSFNF